MKEDCADIRPLLDAWIDGELSDSAGRRVARHAEACPDCREEAESRRGIDAAISADDAAGDPGDAYFATLGKRVSARFDFGEASRHWAKPEKPQRKRRLEIPRAWVPRFAFGIAGAAVATIAGLLVHDLGQRPILPPLPRVTDTVMEARKSQTPAKLPDSPTGMQTARRAPAPSVRLAGPHPLPQAVTPSAGPEAAESAEGAIGATSTSGSTHYRAGSTRGANGPTSAADSTTLDRRALLTFFGTFAETGETRATRSSVEAFSAPSHKELQARSDLADSTPARLRRDETNTPADSISISPRRGDASMPGDSISARLSRDEASTTADSTWLRLRRGEARALADSALATGTLEDCERALRAYWTMLHRDGRPLLPAPTARARALEPDRLRIERLVRCASR